MVQHKQQHKPKHKCNIDYVILLDFGSTIKGTFMNPNLVTNIKLVNIPLQMSTNAGTNKMTLQGEV